MAFDINNIFQPLAPPNFPAVPGTPIVAAYYNNEIVDICNGLTALRAMSSTLGSLTVGTNVSSGALALSVGGGRSASGQSRLDLVGDTTYPSYGLTLVRAAGANNGSQIRHRGTGPLDTFLEDGSLQRLFTLSNSFRTQRNGGNALADSWQASKSRSSAIGSVGGAVQSGDELWRLEVKGDDGTDAETVAARFRVVTPANAAANVVPGRLFIGVAPTVGADAIADAIGVDQFGRLFGYNLHNNAQSPTGTAEQFVASGTYTPVVGFSSNISSITPERAQWLRVGNVVTVSGAFVLTPTTSNCQFEVNPPIPSAFALDADAAGVGFSRDNQDIWEISSNFSTDRVRFASLASGPGVSRRVPYTYTFLVL